MTTETPDLYRVEPGTVVAGVACTYCAAGIGADCHDRRRQTVHAHAQRWWDYWNATHDRSQQIAVFVRQGAR